MRRRFIDLRAGTEWAEKILVRVLMLLVLVLAIAQLGLARNPMDFYLAMAAKVENTPLDVPASALTETPAAGQRYTLSLKAVPNAAVKVWQDGHLVGDLTRGVSVMQVSSGQVLLDGRGISGTVRVQVMDKDQRLQQPALNQISVIQGNVRALTISP